MLTEARYKPHVLFDSAQQQKGGHVQTGRLSTKGTATLSHFTGKQRKRGLPHGLSMGVLGYIVGQVRPQSRDSQSLPHMSNTEVFVKRANSYT